MSGEERVVKDVVSGVALLVGVGFMLGGCATDAVPAAITGAVFYLGAVVDFAVRENQKQRGGDCIGCGGTGWAWQNPRPPPGNPYADGS
jgi:hypothetical protein